LGKKVYLLVKNKKNKWKMLVEELKAIHPDSLFFPLLKSKKNLLNQNVLLNSFWNFRKKKKSYSKESNFDNKRTDWWIYDIFKSEFDFFM